LSTKKVDQYVSVLFVYGKDVLKSRQEKLRFRTKVAIFWANVSRCLLRRRQVCYPLIFVHLPARQQFLYFRKSRPAMPKMLRLTDSTDSRRWRWCSVVVLVAAISLTVSLATRYGASQGLSPSSVTAVQRVSSLEPVRQRLLKNAATWMPPVICAAILDVPKPRPRIILPSPRIVETFFEKNSYNRPPPSWNPYHLSS
jgi:hypothetical protein